MKKDLKITQNEALTPQTVPNTVMSNEASVLISQAIDKNVDVSTMEKLLEMRRQLKEEKAKEEFDHAMSSFQAQCPTIEKRKQGYNYKYAPLESIVEQVKELLARNGFSYTFDTDDVENAVIVYCKVKHIGGHMEISKARIEHETTTKMNSSQQSGASMTYGKRYAFVNAFGILTGDEDTDADHKPTIKQQLIAPDTEKIEAKVSGGLNITPEQKTEILDILYRTGRRKIELDAFIYDAFSGRNLDSLTKVEAYKLIARLNKEGKKTVTQEPEVTEEDLDKIAALPF